MLRTDGPALLRIAADQLAAITFASMPEAWDCTAALVP